MKMIFFFFISYAEKLFKAVRLQRQTAGTREETTHFWTELNEKKKEHL